MCEHIFVPDNLRVSRETAIRLGWDFCIKCGEQFPNQKVRNEEMRRGYSKVAVAKPKHKRTYRRRNKATKPSDFDFELKDEPWIDDNGQLWIISPNGSAKKQ